MIPSLSLLVCLALLVDRLPEPPQPFIKRRCGRPTVYSSKLLLKAFVIMIVCQLHQVGELLSVLEQSTAEVQAPRILASEQGSYPSRSTWEQRLSAYVGRSKNVKNMIRITIVAFAIGLTASVALGQDQSVQQETNRSSGRAMFEAIKSHNLEGVAALLNNCADPNKAGSHNRTPLMFAIEAQDTGIFSLLLERGANPNLKDIFGEYPLYYAARADRLDMAVALLHRGAHADWLTSFAHTPLHVAAALGNTAMARLMLKHGAKIDARDSLGETPLMEAATSNHVAMVRFLVSNKARTGIRNNEGKTARMLAKSKGHRKVLAVLP